MPTDLSFDRLVRMVPDLYPGLQPPACQILLEPSRTHDQVLKMIQYYSIQRRPQHDKQVLCSMLTYAPAPDQYEGVRVPLREFCASTHRSANCALSDLIPSQLQMRTRSLEESAADTRLY